VGIADHELDRPRADRIQLEGKLTAVEVGWAGGVPPGSVTYQAYELGWPSEADASQTTVSPRRAKVAAPASAATKALARSRTATNRTRRAVIFYLG